MNKPQSLSLFDPFIRFTRNAGKNPKPPLLSASFERLWPEIGHQIETGARLIEIY